MDITSAQNPKYKTWLSLLETKGIKKAGRALVSGAKLIEELQVTHTNRIEALLLGPKSTDTFPSSIRRYRLTAPLFRALDVIGTGGPLCVVQTPELETWTGDQKPQGLELIVALSDPGNMGACLRSAEAFGADRVILCRECSFPFLPRALRSAAGATWRLNLALGPSLKDINVPVAYGLDMQGENLNEFKWPKNLHLIVGEEGQGLPDTLNVKRLSIPMQPGSESLNAVVATAIALFSYRQQFSLNC